MFIVLVGVISLSSCEHKEHHPEKEATYQVTSPKGTKANVATRRSVFFYSLTLERAQCGE